MKPESASGIRGRTVPGIADHGAADTGEVNADLVLPPGFQFHSPFFGSSVLHSGKCRYDVMPASCMSGWSRGYSPPHSALDEMPTVIGGAAKEGSAANVVDQAPMVDSNENTVADNRRMETSWNGTCMNAVAGEW